MGTTVDAVMELIEAQGALEHIGSFLGRGNEGKSETVSRAVLSALLGAMAYRASSVPGAEALFALVESDDGSALTDVATTLEQGRHQLHGAVVGALLDSSRRAVEAGVADHCGISLDRAAALFPRLLPLAVAGLGRRVSSKSLDLPGMVEVLTSERDLLAASEFRGLIGLVGPHPNEGPGLQPAAASVPTRGDQATVSGWQAPNVEAVVESTSVAPEIGRWRRAARSLSAPFERGRTNHVR